jgi:hypothetical protein
LPQSLITPAKITKAALWAALDPPASQAAINLPLAIDHRRDPLDLGWV